MNPCKSKVAFLAALIVFLVGLVGSAAALESPVEWFAAEFGSSHVLVHLVGEIEETLLMDGLLQYAYPGGFQIQYFTQKAPVSVASQNGFVMVQTGTEVQYGYDRYWLFDDIQNYFFALAEFSKIPVQFSGMDTVAGRGAKRYVAVEDPDFVLWFDEESGIPFLIRQNTKTLVTVSSYILENRQDMTSVELELAFAKSPAKITLDRTPRGWVLARLEIQEARGHIQMEFSEWSIPNEWMESPLQTLARLSELNDRFLIEFEAGHLDVALGITQEMLGIAPQFWQVYLYRAFTYEGFDNFLGVVENYQQVLMRQPDNALALNNLAYHYLLREVQIPQALEMAERAVEIDRKDIYLDTLGYGYYLAGRLGEAKALLLEALETAPEEAITEIIEHLALVLKALGEE